MPEADEFVNGAVLPKVEVGEVGEVVGGDEFVEGVCIGWEGEKGDGGRKWSLLTPPVAINANYWFCRAVRPQCRWREAIALSLSSQLLY